MQNENSETSFLKYQYDGLCESLKEIWQNECEAFIMTTRLTNNGLIQQDQVNEMLRDIKEQLKVYKDLNELQKEECFSLL